MEIGETLHAETAAAWRAWLEEHAASARDIWLVMYKKDAGGRCIDYESAVEEAACFGWVDSMVRRMDDRRYATRFTPRRKNSHWTPGNLARALRLISEGRMTPAGVAALPEAARPPTLRHGT